MARENLNDLMAFIVVAREKSFTRAAAHLGISQSALSHSMRTLYAWEFEKDGKSLNVKVNGQLVFGRIYQNLEAALNGYGLAHVPRDIAEDHIKAGKLVSVLEDWCPYWDGYYIYYPENRNHSKAFQLVVDALRHYQAP